jgi:uncharacterized membrane protein YphA (DoxX/SURF4 family)
MMWKTQPGILFIQIGLAFSFVYAAVGGFSKPENWIGWFPRGVRGLFPFGDNGLLILFGIVEMLIALWLVSGWKLEISAFVAAAFFFGITIANWSSMDIVFRDIALGLVACGVAIITRKNIPRTR